MEWTKKEKFTKEEMDAIVSMSRSTELRMVNRSFSRQVADQYTAIFHLTEFGPPFPAKELIRLAKIGWDAENCTG